MPRPTVPFIDLSQEYQSLKMEIDHAVSDTLKRGRFILGEQVEDFEREFASYCGVRCGVGVGSGTDALTLSLLACGVGPEDAVITVPNTAVPTVAAIVRARAFPIFVDVNPQTYTLDVEALGRFIETACSLDGSGRLTHRASGRRIAAIIPVHLYGHPCDMDAILGIARHCGVKVIEDACQAHGAKYKGQKVGSLGDAGCFSFYPTKNLGCYGDGGMVVTDQESIAHQVLLLRNYGQESRDRFVLKGFNSRLDELQAAVLRVKLKHLDQWNVQRRRLASTYGKTLTVDGIVTPEETDYAWHVYHLYVIRTPRRDALRQSLHDRGIMTLIHYPVPVYLHQAYQDLGWSEGSCPVAEKIAEEVVSLPLHGGMSPKDVQYVSGSVREIVAKQELIAAPNFWKYTH